MLKIFQYTSDYSEEKIILNCVNHFKNIKIFKNNSHDEELVDVLFGLREVDKLLDIRLDSIPIQEENFYSYYNKLYYVNYLIICPHLQEQYFSDILRSFYKLGRKLKINLIIVTKTTQIIPELQDTISVILDERYQVYTGREIKHEHNFNHLYNKTTPLNLEVYYDNKVFDLEQVINSIECGRL